MTHRIARGLLVATGVFCVLLWMALLVLGLTVDSKPYRAALLTGFDPTLLIQVALFYTPINVALLTCLAGLIGGISSNLTFHPAAPPAEAAAAEVHRAGPTENPFASLLVGYDPSTFNALLRRVPIGGGK
jgi:hypothetical protein